MLWRAGLATRLALLIVVTVIAVSGITAGFSALYFEYQRGQIMAQLRPERGFDRNPTGAIPALSDLQAPGQGRSPRPPWSRRPRADGMPWVIVGSGLVSMLLGTALALRVAQRISKPLEAVSKTAARMGAGDLSARVVLEAGPHNPDEISTLAHEFNQMANQLERNERARKDMIADIAHELRTPITVMRSRLEALEDGVFPLVPAEVVRLQDQTTLLERLVNDLRTLSLADTGQLEWNTKSFDLFAHTQTVVHGFETQASAKGVKLEVNGLSTQMHSDPDRTAQVISNLVSNAIRHARSSVLVELHNRPEEVALVVRDDGPGIPPDSLERVFQRFYRTDASRTRSSGGTGLGLSIVEALVRLQGGSVAAQNRADGGAEFLVRWPLFLKPEGGLSGI